MGFNTRDEGRGWTILLIQSDFKNGVPIVVEISICITTIFSDTHGDLVQVYIRVLIQNLSD